MSSCGVLVIMSGLPATGKTTIARIMAGKIHGVHLRIDTIEQAIVRAGAATRPVGAVGYVIGYALAADFLRQGLTVVAESVNPLAITRAAWRDVAEEAKVAYLEVEVVCSDPAEHERRATTRVLDIPDLEPPTWQAIQQREYEPWDRDRVVLDSALHSVDECADHLLTLLGHTSRGQV